MTDKSKLLAEGRARQDEGRRQGLLSLRPPLLEGLAGEKAEKRLVLTPLEGALYHLTCTINERTTPIQDALISLMKELGAEEASIHLLGRDQSHPLEHYMTVRKDGGEFVVSPIGDHAGYMSAAAFSENSMFYSVPPSGRRSSKGRKSSLFRFNMVPGDMEYSVREVKNGDRQVCAVPLFMAEDEESSKKLGVLTLKGRTLSVQDARRTGEDAVQKAAILIVCGARLLSRVVDARFDTLTGLQKRAEFEAQLGKAVAEYVAGGPNFSILLFDLDHFKEVNDMHGHDVGDIALREVATKLSGGLRSIWRPDVQERRAAWLHSEVDQCFRWGGEEIVAVLPGTNIAEAVLIAERLRQSIAAAPVEAEGERIRLSVSTGVSDADSVIGRKERHDTDVENLHHKVTREADYALYTAKRSGRNIVAYVDGSADGQRKYIVHGKPA